ncbi:hypothetical protein C6P46_006734 [Rhodotorula mucilaginosa]|uniref:Methionine adenosyltransferase II beta n=1 Tax=Rhodotorula mucilaginosa TaxID=5537 RepID=A0A9P6VXV2_RHOMI|nr:hypothetical protein C6P46_006734 [Rhodotorula mucilaginosa]
MVKTLVTGASGLLGRAVLEAFKQAGHEVKGTAYSRANNDLVKKERLASRRTQLDLQDDNAVKAFLDEYRPDVVVHCAAERRPDAVEANPEAVQKLNVGVPALLSTLSRSSEHPFFLLYISTDYVFDGHAPADGYEPEAATNPTNAYGVSKLEGEHVVLAGLKAGGKGCVLRLPVLYGPAESNSESAINVLVDAVEKAAKGTPVKMDNWAIRNPTCVEDIARVLRDLAVKSQETSIPAILHFSAQQMYTKYDMAQILARVHQPPLEVGDNLVRVDEGPKPGETRAIEALGIDTTTVDFEAWYDKMLKRGTSTRSTKAPLVPPTATGTAATRSPPTDPVAPGEGIPRPTDVLVARLNEIKRVSKSLAAYYATLGHAHEAHGKALTTLAQGETIRLPWLEQDLFLPHVGAPEGEGGWAELVGKLKDGTGQEAEDHLELSRITSSEIVEPLKHLRVTIKNFIADLEKHVNPLLTEVTKAREHSFNSIQALTTSVGTYTNSPLTVSAEQDPLIVRAKTESLMREQITKENELLGIVKQWQERTKTFEAESFATIATAVQKWEVESLKRFDTTRAHGRDIISRLDRLNPEVEWQHFMSLNYLIPDDTPTRSLDVVDYPDNAHASTKPIKEGILERKKRVVKNWKEAYFVLSSAGFLHEYPDSTTPLSSPSTSLFLPNCVVTQLSKSPNGTDTAGIPAQDQGPAPAAVQRAGLPAETDEANPPVDAASEISPTTNGDVATGAAAGAVVGAAAGAATGAAVATSPVAATAGTVPETTSLATTSGTVPEPSREFAAVSTGPSASTAHPPTLAATVPPASAAVSSPAAATGSSAGNSQALSGAPTADAGSSFMRLNEPAPATASAASGSVPVAATGVAAPTPIASAPKTSVSAPATSAPAPTTNAPAPTTNAPSQPTSSLAPPITSAGNGSASTSAAAPTTSAGTAEQSAAVIVDSDGNINKHLQKETKRPSWLHFAKRKHHKQRSSGQDQSGPVP